MKTDKVRLFWSGQEVMVRGYKVPFPARITGPANYEGTVASLMHVSDGEVRRGFCGSKGLEPME